MKKYIIIVFISISIKDIGQNRFPSSGNVGIGTITPVSNLELSNSMPIITLTPSRYNGSYQTTLGIQSGAQAFLIFGNNDQNEIRAGRTMAGGYLDFYTNNTNDQSITSDGNLAMRLAASGKVGIGSGSPQTALHVGGSTTTEVSIGTTDFGGNGGQALAGLQATEYTGGYGGGYGGGLIFKTLHWGSLPYTPTEKMRIDNNGNVGIGTASPSEKLSVNGNIRSRKLIVTQAGWADYVFDSSYELKPLTEIERFIKTNKHLPDIPSAKEVEKEGIDVGVNQALLLKKIEELTLYIIDINKKVAKQQIEIESLKKGK